MEEDQNVISTIVLEPEEDLRKLVLNSNVNFESNGSVRKSETNSSLPMRTVYHRYGSNSDHSTSLFRADNALGDNDAAYKSIYPNDKPDKSKENILEHENSFIESSTTNNQTLMHLIKGNLGSGLLALPVAFRNAGLWTGLVGILVIGFVTLHCMHALVKCSRILCNRTGKQRMDYAEVAEYCLKTSSSRFARFSHHGRTCVNALLVFTQLGICCINLVFIAKSIGHVVNLGRMSDAEIIQNYRKDETDPRVYELITVVVLIPYAFIRKLEHLSPFSAVANILTLLGIIIIFQYIVQGLPDTSTRPSFSDVGSLPLFFGSAFYTLEGINYVLPLENTMKHPEVFASWDGVLNLGMVIVIVLYASTGFYGYLKFGAEVETSITLNLPQDNWLYKSVVLMFAAAIFITYGIQLYVPVKIIWPSLKEKFNNSFVHSYGEYIFRVFFILVTFGFAAVVPHLDLLIALVGAFASSFLAIILPVIIEIATLSEEERPLPWWLFPKNTIILLFGVLGCFTGTYSALREIGATF